MDESTYRAWSLIVDAFGAAGTIAAVIAALYLARKQDQPKIKVKTMICNLYNIPGVSHDQDYVNVEAKNIGIMKEHVGTFGYTIGAFFWKSACVVNPSPNHFAISFNSDIEPGQSVSNFIEIEKFDEAQLDFFIKFIRKYLPPKWLCPDKWFPHIAMLSARCWVSPSRGRSTSAQISKDIRKHVIAEYRKTKNGQVSDHS